MMATPGTFQQYFTVRHLNGTACHPPLVELTMVRDATLSGRWTARRAAIMPPMLRGTVKQHLSAYLPGLASSAFHASRMQECADTAIPPVTEGPPVTDDVCSTPLQVILRSQSQRRCIESARDLLHMTNFIVGCSVKPERRQSKRSQDCMLRGHHDCTNILRHSVGGVGAPALGTVALPHASIVQCQHAASSASTHNCPLSARCDWRRRLTIVSHA